MSSAEVADGSSMTLAAQDSLLAAMLDREFYPKPPAAVTHKETHISHLFFAGELVYKVKKPVRYSFLDYSTLKKRRYFLQEELRLNRRLAPSVYIGVLPITFDDLGWRLGGWGEPAEYTLVMRRSATRRLASYYRSGKVIAPWCAPKLIFCAVLTASPWPSAIFATRCDSVDGGLSHFSS